MRITINKKSKLTLEKFSKMVNHAFMHIHPIEKREKAIEQSFVDAGGIIKKQKTKESEPTKVKSSNIESIED